MLALATPLCWASGIAVLVATFASISLSNAFFGKLRAIDPTHGLPSSDLEFRDGGPIHSERVRYLERKAFLALTNDALRMEGRRVHLWLRLHAVAFLAFLLCMFWRMALVA